MADVDSSLLLFCKEIRKYCTVALSGECADEIFGGYPWYRDPKIRATYGFPWAQSTKYRMGFLNEELAEQINAVTYVDQRYQETLKQSDILCNRTKEERRLREMVNLNMKWFMQTLLDLSLIHISIQILDHTHRFLEFKPMYDNLKQASVYQKDWFEKKKLEPLQSYFNLIEEMKKMELPIAVRFGLEVCYAPQDKAFLRDLLAGYPYDFLIGSIHSIDGLLYDMNGFSREILWDKYDTNAIYRRYYEIMEDMIESDLFTQIGHPDQLKIFHYEPDYDLKPTYERLAVLAKEHDVYTVSYTHLDVYKRQ